MLKSEVIIEHVCSSAVFFDLIDGVYRICEFHARDKLHDNSVLVFATFLPDPVRSI